MNVQSTIRNIHALRTWAPHVLRQGRRANREDLKKIIRMRARVQHEVPKALERQDTRPFFGLIKADQECAPLCGTLLNLTEEEARAEVTSVGGFLNPWVWYGVHNWELTRTVLTAWKDQISEASQVKVTEAEVLQAYTRLAETRDTEYMNVRFVTDKGGYRPELLEEDQCWFAGYVHRTRLWDVVL